MNSYSIYTIALEITTLYQIGRRDFLLVISYAVVRHIGVVLL
mgnify:CR=1 FL=1